ncbi:MAG TPA: hypothetical protein VIG33_17450 [Pseudobdellovibrionaceae bacterium]|jgi:hypothetical protein
MSQQSWQQIQSQKFQKAITSIESSPYLLHLYFRYCGHPSFVGDEIREIEKLYLQNSEKEWNHFHAKTLNLRLQHLLAQIKVGILWGLTGEINNWKNQEEELAEICTKLFSFFEDLSSAH